MTTSSFASSKLPLGWESIAIGSIATIYGRIGFRGYTKADIAREGDGALALSPSNIQRNQLVLNQCTYISWEKYHESPEIKIYKGDLILVKTGSTTGKTCYVDNLPTDATINPQMVVFKNVSCNRRLLGYIFSTPIFLDQIRSTIVGGALPTLSQKQIALYRIVLPHSLEEQNAIAEVLLDMDALLGKLDHLIAKKRDLKVAAMQQLLTGKKRLPGFSDEWEVKRLEDISEIVMGQSPSSSNYNRNGVGLPLIQGNADIHNRKTIRRIYTSQITKRGNIGDILMSVRAPVGEISLAMFDICIGRGVCAIRFNNNFLYHSLISLEPSWVKHSKGSTFDSVNSFDVKAFEIFLPSDPLEQIAIADVLSKMDEELVSLETRREKTALLKQGMMQVLLTGKTRLI